jgi:polar amino acid transport system substrate-binding protein
LRELAERGVWRAGTDRRDVFRRTVVKTRCVFALLLALVGPAPAVMARDSVSITVGEWPPYVSADLKDYGVAPRIVSAAFDAVEVRAEYVFFPWMRALSSAKDGKYDATLLWVRTSEREKDFVFSDVVITGKAVFYHLKARPFSWKTIDDLVGLRIGGLSSGSYPWFDAALKAGKDLRMDRVSDEVTNFQKLLVGRIDVISLDQLTGSSILAKHFSPDEIGRITFDPVPIEAWDYCLMFSRKSAKTERMVALFNEGLKKLRHSGEYARLTR